VVKCNVVLLFLAVVRVRVNDAVALRQSHVPLAPRAWTILQITVIPELVLTVAVYANAPLLVRVKDRHAVV